MKNIPATVAPLLAGIIAVTAFGTAYAGNTSSQTFSDPSGLLGVVNLSGTTNTSNAFFQSLGTNGRSCATCHVASQAFSFSAAAAQARFAQSGGNDPLFASFDGANCIGVGQGDRAGHSLILQNGLIRIPLPMPPNAQFTISVVHDPYGCATVPDPNSGQLVVSVYRRPLPTTNLRFLSTVMFDGRETLAPLSNSATFPANLVADLTHQATDATLGHAQAAQPPTTDQLTQIVNFELGLFTAQSRDALAGNLTAVQAQGGPEYLANQPYYPGINDSLGKDPTGAAFNPSAMTLFASWAKLSDTEDLTTVARRAIAAGEELFNTFPMHITNVRGLNDNPALGSPTSITGHCTSCHDTPNVGNHSLPLPLDIGTAHTPLSGMETDAAIAAAVSQLSMPDLPIYLIQGCPNPFAPAEPESFYTSDPGKALVTGQCADFNRIKGPILRGLAARAPYFHNGAAATLNEVVNFYDKRFGLGLTDVQKANLVAFLNSL